MAEAQAKTTDEGKILEMPNIPAFNAKNQRIGLAFIPFTPVPFSGEGAIWAWSRIAIYGTIAYFAWGKMKPLAYAAMGAAGISAMTSLAGNAWNGNGNA